jgi:hypothetical protein
VKVKVKSLGQPMLGLARLCCGKIACGRLGLEGLQKPMLG